MALRELQLLGSIRKREGCGPPARVSLSAADCLPLLFYLSALPSWALLCFHLTYRWTLLHATYGPCLSWLAEFPSSTRRLRPPSVGRLPFRPGLSPRFPSPWISDVVYHIIRLRQTHVKEDKW
jgi:hypothetical protein